MSDRVVTDMGLHSLRDAIARDDREACEVALRAALGDMSPEAALELASSRVRAGLGTFLRFHPADRWAEEALDGRTLVRPGEYAGPGGNSYAKAVEALLDARESVENPAVARQRCADALIHAIAARAWAEYGRKFPDAWNAWYADAPNYEDPDAPPPTGALASSLHDADVLRVEREEWIAVLHGMTAHH